MGSGDQTHVTVFVSKHIVNWVIFPAKGDGSIQGPLHFLAHPSDNALPHHLGTSGRRQLNTDHLAIESILLATFLNISHRCSFQDPDLPLTLFSLYLLTIVQFHSLSNLSQHPRKTLYTLNNYCSLPSKQVLCFCVWKFASADIQWGSGHAMCCLSVCFLLFVVFPCLLNS